MTHCSQQGETSKAGTLETHSSDPPGETSHPPRWQWDYRKYGTRLTAAQWFNRLVKMHLFRFLINENGYTNYIIIINLMTMLSSMNLEWSKDLWFNGSKQENIIFCILFFNPPSASLEILRGKTIPELKNMKI